ncbi:hypothetical protein B0T14DRAFT_567980 [Immersiella caudata]|uniref:Secreted protein n=1 Tax=Immersiella caudata TaxID=314043 RepID=A0AA39WJ54_9PEZI|nr:hypothetical protein B0T14DRAFT_567980 [Immersiella caudata]
MHLPTIVSIFALAATTAADSMASYRECAAWNVACKSHRAVWFGPDGGHLVSADTGCREGAPGIREMCVDWSMWPPRGHFYYHGQGKRCFVHKHRLELGYNWSETSGDTQLDNWDEVNCTW